MKQVNTFTGTLFLLWFFGSPIFGLLLFSITNIINILFWILLVYLLLGYIFYYLAKKISGKNKKLIANVNQPKDKKWSAVFNYVVGTNVLFFIFIFIASVFTLKLFGNTGLWIIYIVEYPLITLLAARLSLKRTRKLFKLPSGFSKISITLFIGLNLIFGIILQILQKQLFFSWADLGILLSFLVFYSYTSAEFSNKNNGDSHH